LVRAVLRFWASQQLLAAFLESGSEREPLGR